MRFRIECENFAQLTTLEVLENFKKWSIFFHFDALSFSEQWTTILRVKESLGRIHYNFQLLKSHTIFKLTQSNIDRRWKPWKKNVYTIHSCTHFNKLNLNCLIFFCIYNDSTWVDAAAIKANIFTHRCTTLDWMWIFCGNQHI